VSNIWWKNCLLRVGILLMAVGSLSFRTVARGQDPPFSVPDGFVVQRVADDKLAHDCFCMTLDNAGRPIVSGPGYVRTLIDDNSDGIFDRSIDWTREVKQGAQGMWSEGKSLYWVADGGLWRSEDTDGDLVANSRAQRVLELPTGGEHDAHAIKRGPDGCWYLIVGNFAANISRLANDSSAPIARPRAGTLWRMSPDFSRRGVWAHGLRNCYDFDFLPDGQAVTYDSDDEREATLPWYRPTRAFVMGPGTDAGWCGAAWKDDDYRVTMPLVLARLGRGSPTGVAVYEHTSFPERYRDAVFVLDWTFGRVIAIYPSANLKPEERIPDKIPSEVFMEPTGTAGFAPTSACVAPDGSLLVSVGGRGILGAIYRVSYSPGTSKLPPPAGDPLPACLVSAIEKRILSAQDAETLESVLKSPSPWSAWSIARWRPRVTPRVRGQLVDVAMGRLSLDGPVDMTEKYVLRAAQMLTRLGETVSAEQIQRGTSSKDPAVRAAAWWVAGRQSPAATREVAIRNLGANSIEGRLGTRWEVHLGADEERLRWEAIGLKRWPVSPNQPPKVESRPSDSALRRTWLWALSRATGSPNETGLAGRLETQIAKALFAPSSKTPDKNLLDAVTRKWGDNRDKLSQRELMESLTYVQAALGDRRWDFPLQTDAPADISDGYRGLYANQIAESSRNNMARWFLYFAATAKTQGWDAVYAESIRTMAMMEPSDQQCMAFILEQITADSHPTSDLHMLCALAQCTAPRTAPETSKTAAALSEIIRKVKGRGLYTDNQWPIRLNQLVARLTARDEKLGPAFIELSNLYCSEDLALISAFPQEIQEQAREKIRGQLKSASPEEWSIPLVKFAVVGPLDKSLRDALRRGCQLENLHQTCLAFLAQMPEEEDYDLYLSSIEETDRTLWLDAWRGLGPLAIKDPTREFPAIAKLLSASFNTGTPLPRSAILDRARRVAADSQKTPPPSTDSWPEWTAYLQSQLDEAQMAAMVVPSAQADVASILKSIEGVSGNSERGANLFRAKCALCHGGQSALGPSLSGVSKRFSLEDLARAIYEPSRDVPDRYRAIRVLTVDDEVLTGMIIYNAADGVTLQIADGSILRINQDQIEQKAFSTESIMPSGLLDDRSAQEVADLFAYLGTLP
jgi:putative heme-binding domain-containing protein